MTNKSVEQQLKTKKRIREVEEIISEEPPRIVEKASVTYDGRQFLVRFPKRISDRIGLSSEHKVRFTLTLAKPKTGEKPELKMEIIKDES